MTTPTPTDVMAELAKLGPAKVEVLAVLRRAIGDEAMDTEVELTRVLIAVRELLLAAKDMDTIYCEVNPRMDRETRQRHRQVLLRFRAAIANCGGKP